VPQVRAPVLGANLGTTGVAAFVCKLPYAARHAPLPAIPAVSLPDLQLLPKSGGSFLEPALSLPKVAPVLWALTRTQANLVRYPNTSCTFPKACQARCPRFAPVFGALTWA
jgi:hypothetical protein